MKKLTLLCGLMLWLASFAMAQDKAFQFGFKVAPNIGWIKPNAEGYARNGADAGFSWGFVAEIYLMENYAFNTGFDVVYLNGSYTYPHKVTIDPPSGTTYTGVMNRTIRAKYVQLPLVLKMKTNDFNGFVIYGQVGFGLGFLVDAKADDKFYSGGQLIIDERSQISKQLRFTRESLILGGGVEYSLGGSTFLTAGLKFDNGFVDILKDQNRVDPSIENKAISNFLELQIGLLF